MKLSSPTTLLSFTCLFVFLLFSGLECPKNEPNAIDPHCDNINWLNRTDSWRPTPINENDQLLNPPAHLQYCGEQGNWCYYAYHLFDPMDFCKSEYVRLTIEVILKTEYIDDFVIQAYIEINGTNNNHSIEDIDIHTQWDVTTISGGVGIEGDTYALDGKVDFIVDIVVKKKSDMEATHAFVNNAINYIEIDYSFTEWKD